MNLLLWASGAALLAVAVWRVRAPFTRMGELDRMAENARRYESWRGNRSSGGSNERTGADLMRQVVRRRAITWAIVGVIGVVLIFAGFAIR